MAGDRHFAQAARAWCEKALARLLPDLDRGASCPAFKRTPSVKQLILQPHLLFMSLVVCAAGAGLVAVPPS